MFLCLSFLSIKRVQKTPFLLNLALKEQLTCLAEVYTHLTIEALHS